MSKESQSNEISPESERMDISDASNCSPGYNDNFYATSIQVSRLSGAGDPVSGLEKLDNDRHCNSSVSHTNNKTMTIALNPTNSHPLMYSPTSPVTPDYPDLIPEKLKAKPNADKIVVNPGGRSVTNNLEESTDSSFEQHLKLALAGLEEYKEELPDFPESPSALKKSVMCDLTTELSHADFSDNENEKSIYEAHLTSNLQNVSLTLNAKEGNLNFLAHGHRSNKLRRVKVIDTDNTPDSDISSLESITESLKSEDVFVGGNEDVLRDENEQEIESPTEPIEPLSADEERRHARYWQRMVLPGGEQRTIDMRVIEPYKRVLSHGGYVRAGGHTAIVVFSACFLPDKSRVDYDYVMDNLFLYVLWTLERLVTEDYVLVYLHGGATRLPSFSWLKRCYHMVGRRLRKNLNNMYLVHPTLWIKTMLFMAKPFISSKFFRKISYVASLKELNSRLPLEANAIPDKVKVYDNFHCGVSST